MCGEQGGQLAAVTIDKNGLAILSEQKVADAIYKVIRTFSGDFALACSNGLYFASFDPQTRSFQLNEKKVLLQGQLLTQVCEAAPNKFVIGSWSAPWVAYVDRKSGTHVKITSGG